MSVKGGVVWKLEACCDEGLRRGRVLPACSEHLRQQQHKWPTYEGISAQSF